VKITMNIESQTISEEVFIREALRIVKEGENAGITLRLLGSTAIKLHCATFGELYERANRPLTDIDLLTYSRENPKLIKFFDRLGYKVDENVLRYYGRIRHIYWHKEIENLHVDIFFDGLKFCHKINLVDRLKLDSPTISVSDLLLEKMQIVEINEKDLKDTAVLLREHEVNRNDNEAIDSAYIAGVLSDDWGFYHTFSQNMKNVSLFIHDFEPFKLEDTQVVDSRINHLLDRVESEPKSMKWKVRAKVGTKMRWYEEVEEVRR
jgi:hypothetical protein